MGILDVAPLAGFLKVTSPFGAPRASGPHNGVDLRAAVGTPVRACGRGHVVKADTFPEEGSDSGGFEIIVQLENGFRCGYAHLSSVGVVVGSVVEAGEVIGLTGATGQVTGPHLHFTLRSPDGARLDPMDHMPGVRSLVVGVLLGALAGVAAFVALRRRR